MQMNRVPQREQTSKRVYGLKKCPSVDFKQGDLAMITIITTVSKAGVCTSEVEGTDIKNATAKVRGLGYANYSASVAEALNKAGVQLPEIAESFGYNQRTGFKTDGIGMLAILEPFQKAGFCIVHRDVSESSTIHFIFKKSEVRDGHFM